MKKLFYCFLLAVLFTFSTLSVDAARVLFDDAHAQTAGNADWIPSGAYSEMTNMLIKNGFEVDILSEAAPDGKFSSEVLSNYEAVILPEPNDPYCEQEQKALIQFVKEGGGAFIIGDHANADRNRNGWDAVLIFNEFVQEFGFEFTGDDFYEAPVSGKRNSDHPVMFGVRNVGCWAGSSITVIETPGIKIDSLLYSRTTELPYIVATEVGKGRVVVIGDSAPFDDGVGSGEQNNLHDSYDSFMYSHPQFAYNTMQWLTFKEVGKRIPSREVPFHNEALIENKDINILIDAAHGNAASDKMQTFKRHMRKNGFRVYYTLNLLRPDMLEKFATVLVPDPALRYTEAEAKALVDWFMEGGNLVLAGSWDSSKLRGTGTLNFLLSRMGSVIRFNDDQVRDNRHNTRRPWGLLSKTFKENHPITEGLDSVIFWGTCSLITRDRTALTDRSGVDIVVTGNPTSYNYFRTMQNPGFRYPKGTPIPIMAIERIVHGTLVAMGTCNFTDYQYPDSHINKALPGPAPFEHQTAEFITNLFKYLKN